MNRKLAIAALASAVTIGCVTPCDEYKKDPNKYAFTDQTMGPEAKPETRDSGSFTIVVWRPESTPEGAVRSSIEAALKEANAGGSVGKSEDPGDYLKNFARRVPYYNKPIKISFETRFKAKDLKLSEPMRLTWKGSGQDVVVDLNKLENGAPVAGYPTVSKLGDDCILTVPAMLPQANGKPEKTLVDVSMLEAKATGGFKFSKQPPLTIFSETQKKDLEIVWPATEKDGNADQIKMEPGDTIEIYKIDGFTGNPRDIQCRLLPAKVETSDGLVEFKQQRTDMYFVASVTKGESTKILTFRGYTTESGGKVTGHEWKLPPGFPSKGTQVKSAGDLDGLEVKPGDYYVETKSDPGASRIDALVKVALQAGGKDPEWLELTLKVQEVSTSRDVTWRLANEKKDQK